MCNRAKEQRCERLEHGLDSYRLLFEEDKESVEDHLDGHHDKQHPHQPFECSGAAGTKEGVNAG
jgi:hypothetical protein